MSSLSFPVNPGTYVNVKVQGADDYNDVRVLSSRYVPENGPVTYRVLERRCVDLNGPSEAFMYATFWEPKPGELVLCRINGTICPCRIDRKCADEYYLVKVPKVRSIMSLGREIEMREGSYVKFSFNPTLTDIMPYDLCPL